MLGPRVEGARRWVEAKRSMNIRIRRAGFTLTEIMIVVSLVGMLAAIALPRFIRSRATAHTNACINNLRQIDDAIQQWAMEERKNSQSAVDFTDISPYLKRSVVCPAGGASFANSYTITVVGADAVCQRVPGAHLLSENATDVAVASSSSSGSGSGAGGSSSPTPPAQGAPGNGNSNGNGAGSGNGNGGGNGNGSGNGNGNGNGSGNGNGNGHHKP